VPDRVTERGVIAEPDEVDVCDGPAMGRVEEDTEALLSPGK
jgi:hypothetical protein